MGISPVGGGRVIPEVEDTPQSRWGSVVDDSKATGEIVGGEIGDVAAEAGSANDSVQQLAKDLTEVEKRVKGLEGKASSDLSQYAKKSDVPVLVTSSFTVGSATVYLAKLGRVVTLITSAAVPVADFIKGVVPVDYRPSVTHQAVVSTSTAQTAVLQVASNGVMTAPQSATGNIAPNLSWWIA